MAVRRRRGQSRQRRRVGIHSRIHDIGPVTADCATTMSSFVATADFSYRLTRDSTRTCLTTDTLSLSLSLTLSHTSSLTRTAELAQNRTRAMRVPRSLASTGTAIRSSRIRYSGGGQAQQPRPPKNLTHASAGTSGAMVMTSAKASSKIRVPTMP